jgi:hypothetical protein
MNHRFTLLATAALAAVTTLPAAAQTVGVNAAVVNDVRMKTEANPSVHRAVVKERVALGNDIATGPASRLQVLLLDKTNFTLGANARLKVDRFVYDPAKSASAVGLSVTKGAFRFMSGKPLHANPGQSQITTPVASIGIRGTIVELAVGADALAVIGHQPGLPQFTADPETATLVFLRGPGAGAQGGEQQGAIDVTAGGTTGSIVGSGQAFFVPGPNLPPIGPFSLSAEASDQLAMLLGRRGRSNGRFESPLVQNPLVDQFFESGEGDPVSQIP